MDFISPSIEHGQRETVEPSSHATVGAVVDDDVFDGQLLTQVDFPVWPSRILFCVGLTTIGKATAFVAVNGFIGVAGVGGVFLRGAAFPSNVDLAAIDLDFGQRESAAARQ